MFDNQTKRWQELAVYIANQKVNLHGQKLKLDDPLQYADVDRREDVFSKILDVMCEIEKKYPVTE